MSTIYSKTFQLHLYIPKPIFREWNWIPLSGNNTQQSLEENSFNQLAVPLTLLIGMLEFACSNHREKNIQEPFYLDWDKNLDHLCFKHASIEIL